MTRRRSSLLAVVGAAVVAACSTTDTPEIVDTTRATSALPALPTFGETVPDSGPPVRAEFRADSVRLVMVPDSGDQINALQPPVLTTTNGRRILFGASAVTDDSAYFVGEVTAQVPDSALPIAGTLTTSYCRAGEKLCRSATRAVAFAR